MPGAPTGNGQWQGGGSVSYNGQSFQQLNTQEAQALGIIAQNQTAGGGLVDSSLINASPEQAAAYQQWYQTYNPAYVNSPQATTGWQAAHPNEAVPTSTPPTNGSTGSNTGNVNVPQQLANNVNNPTLPTGAQQQPIDQVVQPNQLLTNTYGVNPTGTSASGASQVTPGQINQTSQSPAQTVDPNQVLQGYNSAVGQYTASTTGAAQGTAAQGTVNPLDTVQGQLSQLTNFSAGQEPAWARGAMNLALSQMNASGMANSSISVTALYQAVQQSALNIAAPDAATYFQMDMKNLDNNQQMAMQNVQAQQQSLLSNQSAINAAANFNASSAQQSQQFVANLVSSIQTQNATMTNGVNQFNAAQANTIASQNAGNQLAADEFNQQTATGIDEFNSSLANQRETFNTQMAFAVDQSNALWQRTVNTANTTADNAAASTNAQNTFNMSQSDLAALTQLYLDEASMQFTANTNAANASLSLALASAGNNSSVTNQNLALAGSVVTGAAALGAAYLKS